MRWVLIPSLRITNPLTQRSLPPLLGYCSFFPFPLLETIKSLVRTKEKSFFEHSSPKKASGVSSKKKTTIFPRDRKMATSLGTIFLLFPKEGLFLFILFFILFLLLVWFFGSVVLLQVIHYGQILTRIKYT